MADCADIVPLLSAFKDSELSPLETDQVGLHLENCPTCRETLLDFVLIGHHLRTAMALPALDGFTEAVMGAVADSPRPLRERIRYGLEELRERWVAAAAVAGVAIATASLVLVLAEPQTMTRLSGVFHPPAQPTQLAQNQAGRSDKPESTAPAPVLSSGESSQTYISRLESRHPSVATWSEPDYKTTVIWLGDDNNSGND